MKTFRCVCNNQLFFGNTVCLACQREAVFCPRCREVTSLVPNDDGTFHCGKESCAAHLQKCHNYVTEFVCNGGIEISDDPEQQQTLCEHCRLTEVIPDLTIEGNRELWARLEDAKRRVLYTIELLNLPIGRTENDVEPKLVFDFEADLDTPVYTGHDNGRIIINIREADDVEREKARVAFREPQRTLVGHFRHELGHYYWDTLIKGQREEEYRALFGDERSPDYDTALAAYYQNGPAADWQGNYISAYATMHPWEDFAETFGTYLDLVSILDTARHRNGRDFRGQDCAKLLAEYQQVGILANELNREMGLKDLVPEVFGPKVAEKICYVHRLVANAGASTKDEKRLTAATA
ncbi:zinc-binding metallopeptidase family protein [Planctomicrobium piriforme]|uniref:Zinc-ribbon domain-containing protein n=1 Tax=Planctomicrobium piriforme TaxID=1576369 RepID=A0A1I3GQM8_9PLAN|nr:putative zinc-binding metallopeptidase [Planctomicrobium piriforme]SFI25694.1 hypothetical protein SAMN05421753_10790 [Planctomicrobium piriforme]